MTEPTTEQRELLAWMRAHEREWFGGSNAKNSTRHTSGYTFRATTLLLYHARLAKRKAESAGTSFNAGSYSQQAWRQQGARALRALVQAGLVERVAGGGVPEYVLTDAGRRTT